MRVSPTTCWRPAPDGLGPWTGTHISAFSAEDALETLRGAAARGLLLRDDTPAFYVCRLAAEGATSLGVMGETDVEDLASLDGPTLPGPTDADVARRLECLRVAQAQTQPVVIAHPDEPALSTLVALSTTGEPLYAFEGGDRCLTVWRVVRPMAVESLTVLFGRIGDASVIGGADFAAAALALRDLRASEGAVGPADRALCLLVSESASGGLAHALPDGLVMRRV